MIERSGELTVTDSPCRVVAMQERPLGNLCARCHAETPSAVGHHYSEKHLDASIRPYHVFINHRGPDVKHTLASTISYYFRDTGYNVFFDKTEFQPGQELFPTIKEAISSSSVLIAIFSPNYAESTWCLDELCLMLERMLESGAEIIPVFYNVPPEDLVRLQAGKGLYASAFAKLATKSDGNRKRYDSKELDRWKDALKKVSKISGLNLKDFNGDEGKLVHTVVGRVLELLRKERKKAVREVVGLEDELQGFMHFKQSLSESQNVVKKVGIVGPAGSGKTNLAEEFYHRQFGYFNRSSLLLGVRKASERNGLPTLQKQLLKDLTHDRLKEINNISHGKEILTDRLKRLCHGKERLRFLMVIDDIDNQDQLDALLLDDEVLGYGSLVIVTSRDKAVLELSGISSQYEVKPLSEMDAGELLCRHAFHQPQPIPKFKGLVKTAVRKCGRLSKFLKLIGGNLRLYGKDNEDYWEEELQVIYEMPEILKASYGALGEDEKQIFLDIACFFVGMERNSAIRIWGGSEWRGARALQKLEYMCLVQIDDNNQLKMHDHLCDLGRHIADQQLHNCPDVRFRMWRQEDVRKFLPEIPSLPEHIKIREIVEDREAARRSHQSFGRKELKTFTSPSSIKIELLDIKGSLPYDTCSDHIRDLVWFRWNGCPYTTIPPLEMSNLRVLELVKGSLTTLWSPSFKIPSQLRELNLIKCRQFVAIPATIGFLKHLEKMTLNGTVCLKTLPHEFCELKALKHLELRQCEGLASLPDDFGRLTNLQQIHLSCCQKLSELPLSFGQLIQLRNLELQNCKSLVMETSIFGEIRTIEQLNLENCHSVRQLPGHLICQSSMRKLNLLGTSLEEFPENTEQLRNLEHLVIGSPFLRRIPSSLGNLRSLGLLQLFNCTQVTDYPRSIGHLVRTQFSEMQKERGNGFMTSCVYRSQMIPSGVENNVNITSPSSEGGTRCLS